MSKPIARFCAFAAAAVAVVGAVVLVDTLRSQEDSQDTPAAAPTQTTVPADGSHATVTKVIDGDTIVISTGERVRLLGLDAPETQNGHHDCYGTEATAQLEHLLALGTDGGDPIVVGLTPDLSQDNTDRYGRLLRYVANAQHTDVTLGMIQGGWARDYDEYPVDRTPQYAKAESQARETNRGGWSACNW